MKPALSALAALVLLAACQSEGPPPPDVVVIMTDDQGFGDFGFLGSTQVDTPHLDILAAGSARLAQFYVHPVCAPTRAALMTGRYPQRTRAFDTYVGRALLEPEETTIAELLRDAGYATGIFGKWHLGDCAPMRPQDQGFDHALVHRGGGIGQPSDPSGGERKYTDPVLFENGARVALKGYCTDLYFEHAMAWMAAQRAAGRPSFTYIPTNAPHGPFHDVPADWLAHYQERFPDDDRLARIFAMISNVDANVGRLVASLEDAGKLENTLIVFLVDNGPNTRRYVGDLRGMKSEVHEGGVRSPLLAHWPARLQPRVVEAGFGANIDLLPTLLEACGVEAPTSLAFDGRSLLPALEHGQTIEERTLVVQIHRGDRPLRYHHFLLRRGDWKLVNPSGFGKELDESPALALELYDLAADPGEAEDLVDEHPELASELLAEYDAWFDAVCVPEGDYLPPPIHLGDAAERRVVLTHQDWRRRAGSGWADQGVWRVDVLEPGPWELTLRLRGQGEPVRAFVHCGPVQFEQELTGDGEVFVLDPLTLALGVQELRIDVHAADGAVKGPYQVVARPTGG